MHVFISQNPLHIEKTVIPIIYNEKMCMLSDQEYREEKNLLIAHNSCFPLKINIFHFSQIEDQ